jgi:hypothetical protein
VIENLQAQPGKALPERKDLAELQQRGIEQNQQKAQGQQQQVLQDQQKLAAQQQQLEQSRKAAAQAQAAAAAPGASPQQKQTAETAGAAVTQQEQAVAEQSKKVQQGQQAVAQTQAQVAAEQKSAQQQRATIAADEQANIKQQAAQQHAAQQQAAQPQAQTTAGTAAAPGQLLFVYVVAASPDKLGKLVLIDRVSGKLLSQSDINTVRGRTYVTVGSSIVVVAGATGGNAAVRLVAMDPATLAVQKQGTDNIAPTSYLAASDASVYAVLGTSKGGFLGRFDATLALQAQSEAVVDTSTCILVSGAEVFVQDAAGNILILNKDDLKEKKRNG